MNTSARLSLTFTVSMSVICETILSIGVVVEKSDTRRSRASSYRVCVESSENRRRMLRFVLTPMYSLIYGCDRRVTKSVISAHTNMRNRPCR